MPANTHACRACRAHGALLHPGTARSRSGIAETLESFDRLSCRCRHSLVGAGHAREHPRLPRVSRAWRARTLRSSAALDWEWRKVRSSESGAGSGLRRAYMSGIAGSDPGHVGRRGTGMYPAPVAANPSRALEFLDPSGTPKTGRVRSSFRRAVTAAGDAVSGVSVENRFPLLDKGHHRFAMLGRLVGERLVAGG